MRIITPMESLRRTYRWGRRLAYTAAGFFAAILTAAVAHDGLMGDSFTGMTPWCATYFYMSVAFWLFAALLDLLSINRTE